MERALHPDLVKRCRGIEGDDPDALETLSARDMIDATADGMGKGEDAADRRIQIRIDYLSSGIASVQCYCHRYVDLLHLIDMPDGWKIVNAAWRLSPAGLSPAVYRQPSAGATWVRMLSMTWAL